MENVAGQAVIGVLREFLDGLARCLAHIPQLSFGALFRWLAGNALQPVIKHEDCLLAQ